MIVMFLSIENIIISKYIESTYSVSLTCAEKKIPTRALPLKTYSVGCDPIQ